MSYIPLAMARSCCKLSLRTQERRRIEASRIGALASPLSAPSSLKHSNWRHLSDNDDAE